MAKKSAEPAADPAEAVTGPTVVVTGAQTVTTYPDGTFSTLNHVSEDAANDYAASVGV